MTFLEAAIEVLKREGKSLNTKRLAELAVKHGLLSVVGRDPEGTMQQRLDDALAKKDPKLGIFEVKEGVYGLHVYPPQPYPPAGEAPARTNGSAARDEAGAKSHAKSEAKPEAKAEAPSEAKADAAVEGDGEADATDGAEAPAGEKKGRRRRGRRGRGKRGDAASVSAEAGSEGEADEATADEPAAASAKPGKTEDAEAPAVATPAEASQVAPVASDAAADEGEGEKVDAKDEAAEGEVGTPEDGERRARRRSRRGGRGRRRGEAAAKGDEAGEAAVEAKEASEAAPAGSQRPTLDLTTQAAAAVQAAAELAAAEASSREAGLEDSSTATESELLIDPELRGGATPSDRELDALEEDEEGLEEHEFDLPSGPLLAPSDGASEVTRSDEERAVRAEIPGSGRRGEERGRHRRGRERGKPGERDRGPKQGGGQKGAPQGGPAQGHGGGQQAQSPRSEQGGARPDQGSSPGASRPEHAPRHDQAPRSDAGPPREPRRDEGGPRGFVDLVVDALRGSDGRPQHVKALADTLINRKVADARGGHAEVVRQVRAALVREQRDREADGLRPRVRNLGGGNFVSVDRKLDQELVPLERELGDKASRLREATRAAVRRRIKSLQPPAFEALGRALLDKLGVINVELVRRGDGVAYYGGQKQAGVGQVRTLVAMRPGDVEISRRAVGELRAGLQAKGFDEGLLLAAGRASQEALAELKAGPASVVAHDGQSLATLCIQKGLGVRRVQMPIDYLDLELFSELTEG